MEIALLVAFLLGLRHSLDADHLLAVSTSAARAQTLRGALASGSSWAAGHMLTAVAVTILLLVFKDAVLSRFLGQMEAVVAIMLIGVGIVTLKGLHAHPHHHGRLVHSHPHKHAGETHDHRHLLGMGVVQGLASNDELLVLVSIGLSSVLGLVAGIAVFGAGVLGGMLLFSGLMRTAAARFRTPLVAGSAGLSIVYGALVLFGLL
ncbi:MAG: hypothetical protein HY369_00365 [Candidatus Aenigmarchaeota archaeon]|nr:hypothetical protein [Candidatus Aenigmarchaeota archaeon]